MGLTESCCGGPRSVASDRYKNSRNRSQNEEERKSTTDSIQNTKTIEKKDSPILNRIKRSEEHKRRLTPPLGISISTSDPPCTPESPEPIPSPPLDSPIAHTPTRSSPFPGRMEKEREEKSTIPEKKNKKTPTEILLQNLPDAQKILFQNIKEAQEGKRSGLQSAYEVIQEVKSGKIKSISMDYMIPIHKTSTTKFTSESSMQFCLNDFATFGLYLLYDVSFSNNLKEFCESVTSKLSTMDSADLFENEEKKIHLFESVTLFFLAAAVYVRMCMNKQKAKESRRKLKFNKTWATSIKLLREKNRTNAMSKCFGALAGLLHTKSFKGKLCARTVDEIAVFEGYHDFVRKWFYSSSRHLHKSRKFRSSKILERD